MAAKSWSGSPVIGAAAMSRFNLSIPVIMSCQAPLCWLCVGMSCCWASAGVAARISANAAVRGTNLMTGLSPSAVSGRTMAPIARLAHPAKRNLPMNKRLRWQSK